MLSIGNVSSGLVQSLASHTDLGHIHQATACAGQQAREVIYIMLGLFGSLHTAGSEAGFIYGCSCGLHISTACVTD